MVLFVSAGTGFDCNGALLPSGTSAAFNIMTPKVTKIIMCSVAFNGFNDCVCGINLFINGGNFGRLGCEHSSRYFPFDDIIFDSTEVVLAVRLCFQTRGSDLILNQWTIETNMRSIGPVGCACTNYLPPVVGHTLTGFKGHVGSAIHILGVNFYRCAE